jgi:hypothetical protein
MFSLTGRSLAEWEVTPAVIRRAEIGAAFDDFTWDTNSGLVRIVTPLLDAAARVARYAARCRISREGPMVCRLAGEGGFELWSHLGMRVSSGERDGK